MARRPITRARPYTPRSGAFAGRTFYTERQYRNALARRKGFSSWYRQQRSRPPATGARSLLGMRASEQEARLRAFDALHSMRTERLSLTRAARRAGTTPNNVRRHVGPALDYEHGRYRARSGDRLPAAMTVIGPQGPVEVVVTGSRNRSLVARHRAAINHFAATGDPSRLRHFAGMTVSGVELESDPDLIQEWGELGLLDIDDLYALAA
jgi:hypothetical protein